MSAVFTLLYNEFEVIDASLNQLRKTNVLNLPIYAIDNDYPFLTEDMVNQLKDKYNLTIIGERTNRGLAGGYNELISKTDFNEAILYDCDSYPVTEGWDKAMITIIQKDNVAYLSLMFELAKREMIERGYTEWEYEGYKIWKPHSACVQSISCADLNYLRQIGGMREPKKYYGGLEMQMFSFWNDNHQIGYIDNYFEEQLNKIDKVNPIYTEYKYQYAHRGYDGSFNDFLQLK